jgi:hypothetical protein
MIKTDDLIFNILFMTQISIENLTVSEPSLGAAPDQKDRLNNVNNSG